MPAIVLHQWAISPFCGKVRRVLDHKGLAYEVINYNGIKARKAAGLTGVGKLPVLDYDGERVQDSSDIAVFLEKKHPDKPLFPTDPELRAQTQLWEDWADESLHWFEIHQRFMYAAAREQAMASLTEGRPALERAVFARAAKRIHIKKLEAQGLGRMPLERVEQKLLEHVDMLEALLARRRWLVGDDRTIADIAVAAQLAEILRSSHLAPQISQRAKLAEWLARN
jgi:glutathione S-transferase